MRLTEEYSATTYLHTPSFRANFFRIFQFLAAFLSDSLLSVRDNTFRTLFECALNTGFPFRSQKVTILTDGLNLMSVSAAL